MHRGILGGTFDPPHVAHLVIGEAAYRQLALDIVTYIPAGVPWQKSGSGVTAARHRWAMTVAATADVSYFSCDDREIQRDGWTFTIDTLEELGDDSLTLILGADAASRIRSWHRADEVLERARIAVMGRPGTDREAVEAAIGGEVDWLDTPLLSVSGTELRRRAAQGESVRFLVRDAVWDYIGDHSVYE